MKLGFSAEKSLNFELERPIIGRKQIMKLNKNVKQTTELEIGQLWKVGDFHIEIVQIGKTLCHYRHLRNLGQKGIPVKLEQLQVVKKYLRTNKAELVGNKKKKSTRK